MTAFFEDFNNRLIQDNHSTTILPISDNNTIEQLLVSLDPEKEDTPVIQIMFISDLFETTDRNKLLQFFISFKHSYEASQINDIKRFISVYNQVTPLGAFDIGDDGIFFRYTLLESDNLFTYAINESFKMIHFFATRFDDLVAKLIQDKNVAEVLDETVKAFS